VCRAVAAGGDALLVMPTGSGKSLCYQLPGLVRGGTTVIVSPLIALMEDQTAKLRRVGLRVEPIHSGRPREDLRAACREYLAGRLDYLLLAPERLSVPGFPEMLAKRPPALVAVDEAHCISHWGHDFRRDYRLLGSRLPMLRPAPVLALTATATVRVQDDILRQLAMPAARRFIRGFRRYNLGIEVADTPRGERLEKTALALAPPERRPALVYVPSRKLAEECAAELALRYRAAAYHAGMEAEARSRVQGAFQRGELEVVVATVAFGMGVDKADIRTVVHLSMPGTVEGYYQEIGRAGRDGKPARALLYWSWGDRKIQEGFLARSYPPTGELEKLLQAVPRAGIARERLMSGPVDAETAEAALDKLWIHGGVTVDADDVVRPAGEWRASYEAIRDYRAAQLDEMLEYAQSGGCRMTGIVRYFGDLRDRRPCGHCDACAPRGCVGRSFRPATQAQRAVAEQVLDELAERDGLAAGTLLRNLFPSGGMERGDFEKILAAMERARAISLRDDEFEKDGRLIRFRRAHLSQGARAALDSPDFVFDASGGRGPAVPKPAVPPKKRSRREAADAAERAPEESSLVLRLKEWRRVVARVKSVPAFRIMGDGTLCAIADAAPATVEELHSIRGVGPALVSRYGEEILRVVRGS